MHSSPSMATRIPPQKGLLPMATRIPQSEQRRQLLQELLRTADTVVDECDFGDDYLPYAIVPKKHLEQLKAAMLKIKQTLSARGEIH